MLKLIIKDFAIQKATIKRYIISALLISAFFWFTDMKQMAIGMAMFPIIYGFLNGALYEDEKNNTLRLLAALPFKREVIVYARYVSVALITIFSALLFWGGSLLIPEELTINGTEVTLSSGILICALSLTFILLVSIYLPIAFKLGYIKAVGINRFIMIALFGAIGAGGAAVGRLSKNGEPPEWVLSMGQFFMNVNPIVILSMVVVFIVLLYLVSMALSVKFFKARNLF